MLALSRLRQTLPLASFDHDPVLVFKRPITIGEIQWV